MIDAYTITAAVILTISALGFTDALRKGIQKSRADRRPHVLNVEAIYTAPRPRLYCPEGRTDAPCALGYGHNGGHVLVVAA